MRARARAGRGHTTRATTSVAAGLAMANRRFSTASFNSALTGITRDSVHALAADAGIEIRTRRLTRDDVYIADEAFFTGTAAEITPIREVDQRVIGTGTRGPITQNLQTAFFDAVHGRNPKYLHWLSKV